VENHRAGRNEVLKPVSQALATSRAQEALSDSDELRA